MLDALKSQVIDLQSDDILEAIRSLAASGNIHFPSKRGAECGMYVKSFQILLSDQRLQMK